MKKINCYTDFGEGKYIIARFRNEEDGIKKHAKVCLICLEDGNRWEEPITISPEEFRLLCDGKKEDVRNIVMKVLSKTNYLIPKNKIKITTK